MFCLQPVSAEHQAFTVLGVGWKVQNQDKNKSLCSIGASTGHDGESASRQVEVWVKIERSIFERNGKLQSPEWTLLTAVYQLRKDMNVL